MARTFLWPIQFVTNESSGQRRISNDSSPPFDWEYLTVLLSTSSLTSTPFADDARCTPNLPIKMRYMPTLRASYIVTQDPVLFLSPLFYCIVTIERGEFDAFYAFLLRSSFFQFCPLNFCMCLLLYTCKYNTWSRKG